MTEERLAEIRRKYQPWFSGAFGGVSNETLGELLSHIDSLRTRLDQAEKDPRDRLPIRGEVYKRPNSTEAYFVTGTASGAHARTCVNIDVRTGITYETLLRTDVWPLDKWHDWGASTED